MPYGSHHSVAWEQHVNAVPVETPASRASELFCLRFLVLARTTAPQRGGRDCVQLARWLARWLCSWPPGGRDCVQLARLKAQRDVVRLAEQQQALERQFDRWRVPQSLRTSQQRRADPQQREHAYARHALRSSLAQVRLLFPLPPPPPATARACMRRPRRARELCAKRARTQGRAACMKDAGARRMHERSCVRRGVAEACGGGCRCRELHRRRRCCGRVRHGCPPRGWTRPSKPRWCAPTL